MKNILDCTGHQLKIPNIIRSDGVYLFDSDEKRYMDLESGVWCAALGHKNRRINDAIKDQIDRIMHVGFCYSSEIVDSVANSLLNLTNFESGKCVFLSSGSEAIEILRQISRTLSGKEHKTLTLHDAYLGSYSSVIDREKNWYSFNWEKCETCPSKNACDSSCKALLSIPENISEFVFEPGSASGFVRFPPKALIKKIVSIVRKNKGKVIANEVTTGIGRTGKWFGYQHYDIEPDMIAVGKGVGNGYPVSVAIVNKEIASELQESSFDYMQGHQNDPLAAAVVREVIQTITDENLIEGARKKGVKFHAQLESLVDGKVAIGIRGRGLMFAIDLASERITSKIYDDLIERGYIVCNRGSFLRIDPPLTIIEQQFSEFVDALSCIIASNESFT
ncbi:Acetylornithine transaminase [Thiorhodococcus drewsii AZ1]|uniref:Acetylornithine transaminase n=1 Tax=Thiorhodococcus drewsii AZ1 TaxID=765913 RepID=G2E8M0_9GAMM|nr:aminotransferase class III-fold pyridoxal phosphate-dependent enzyme [Thiorhodococcus drewsii]EGV27553.1 Acetylornithine transaminase [Thiorhodococcus drewsii AZ1]